MINQDTADNRIYQWWCAAPIKAKGSCTRNFCWFEVQPCHRGEHAFPSAIDGRVSASLGCGHDNHYDYHYNIFSIYFRARMKNKGSVWTRWLITAFGPILGSVTGIEKECLSAVTKFQNLQLAEELANFQCFHNAFTTVSPFFNGSVGLGLRFAFWLIGSVVQLRRNESKSWFKDMGLVHNCVKILEVNLISLASTDLVQVHTSVDFCFYGLWATWPCLLSVVFSCECCKPLCIAKLAVACSPRSKMHGIFCFRRLRRAALPKLPARSSEDPRCAGLSSVVSK